MLMFVTIRGEEGVFRDVDVLIQVRIVPELERQRLETYLNHMNHQIFVEIFSKCRYLGHL